MSDRVIETSILADGDCPSDWEREDLLDYAQWAAKRLNNFSLFPTLIPDEKTLARMGRTELLELIEKLR